MNAERIISGCGFFLRLDAQRRERLASLAEARTFARGQVIFRQGDDPAGLFIVATGLVRVYQLGPSGKEHVLHLAGPGMTFGEVAVLGDFPAPAFADANRKTTCLLLPSGALRATLRSDHELCLQVLGSMAFWVRHLVGLLEGIVLRDAAGRVAHWLLDQVSEGRTTIELPSQKKDIASHLNLTSETLSRTLRQLREDGLIEEPTGQRIVIKSPERMREVAEGFFPRV
ncbi:MAG: Crp/Fnr family transcriptional regulator [Candidatus Riflebacteria bacterium]|nr:Crp/Fnr family transcriptional regulator [Candidatus Riflebacteria bacterium]